MAAFGTLTEVFTPLRNALLVANGEYLNRLNDRGVKSNNGAVTWRITTAVVPATYTDGTPLTNGAARTEVAGTPFRYVHPVKLAWDEVNQFADPSAWVAELTAAQNGAQKLIDALVIAALVAATPGETNTLPAGQMNFSSDGSVAKQYLAMNKLDAAITYVEANCAGKPRSDIFILASLAHFKNLKTLKNNSTFAGRFDQQDGRWTVDGIPIFTTTYTTNFGGASKDGLYVIHGDGIGLVWNDLFSPTDFEFSQADDGFAQVQIHCGGLYKVLQASHVGCVDSTTS